MDAALGTMVAILQINVNAIGDRARGWGGGGRLHPTAKSPVGTNITCMLYECSILFRIVKTNNEHHY